MTTGHNLINTGAGWRCFTCGVAWDQGEDTSGECGVLPEGSHTAVERVTLDLFDTSRGLDGMLLGPVETTVAWKPKDTTIPFGSQMAFATGDSEFLRDDVGDRRFFPITDVVEGGVDTIDPMKRQVGANHYRNLAIQPTEFCQRNGLDFCIGSILKYLTRYRAKNGIEDLSKARHFVEIREAFPWHIESPRRIEITMVEYVTRNNIGFPDAEVLYRLEAYYNGPHSAHERGAQRLIVEIDKLIAAMG